MMPHRFPIMGSKRLLKARILPALLRLADGVSEYREPFAGSAQIGVTMISYRPDLSVWLNDRDPRIAAIWLSVKQHPGSLIERVETFVPSVPAFREFKTYLDGITALSEHEDTIVEIGFRRLALAYLFYSGHGTGCRGGHTQRAGKIDERWSASRLVNKIQFHHRRLNRVGARITCADFQAAIEDTSRRSLLYLDPPYRNLNYYGCRFARHDDERLADLLAKTEHAWALSYGDNAEIRRLYGWARIKEIGYDNLLIEPAG